MKMNMSQYIEKLLDEVEIERLPLENVAELKRGRSITKKDVVPGNVPVVAGGQSPAYYHDQSNRTGQTIVIAGSGAYAGFVSWWEQPIFVSDAFSVKPTSGIIPKYCYHWLLSQQEQIYDLQSGGGVPHVYPRNLAQLRIPVPCPENPKKSLAIQTEIAHILDTFTELTAELTAELTERKEQYNHYREQILDFEGALAQKDGFLGKLLDGASVEWVSLGDQNFFEVANRGRKPVKSSLRISGSTPYYGANNVQDFVDGHTHDGEYTLIAEDGSASLENYSIQYTTGKFWANNHVHVVCGKQNVNTRYLFHYFCTVNFIPFLTGGGRAKLTKGQMIEISIPIPCPEDPKKSLAIQAEIVRILDRFDSITTSLTEGLPREIEQRQKQYEYYRNMLLDFPDPSGNTCNHNQAHEPQAGP